MREIGVSSSSSRGYPSIAQPASLAARIGSCCGSMTYAGSFACSKIVPEMRLRPRGMALAGHGARGLRDREGAALGGESGEPLGKKALPGRRDTGEERLADEGVAKTKTEPPDAQDSPLPEALGLLRQLGCIGAGSVCKRRGFK